MAEFLANVHFLRPAWLLLLLPIALLAWQYRRVRDPMRSLSGIVAPHLLAHLVVAPRKHRRLSPGTVLVATLVTATFAVAGPSWEREPSPFAADAAALMIVLSVTPSMEKEDLVPSRLERARHKIHDLLALRSGARSGLVAYSGTAHLVVPPTEDGRVVEQLAAALSPEVLPVEGDALADALRIAAMQLTRDGGTGSIVVMTDAVAQSQLSALVASTAGVPVQFLATVASATAQAQAGIDAAGNALGAPVVRLAADGSDVDRLDSHARSVAAKAPGAQERWRDAGYLLLPLLLVGALVGAVRGFHVRFE